MFTLFNYTTADNDRQNAKNKLFFACKIELAQLSPR